MTETRTIWALGDYDRFARATVWELGPVLVDACGVSPGQQVLDVAAGTGNVALRAAMAGAHVVASDLEPEHFDAGRRAAASPSIHSTSTPAAAAALPFDDGAFDVVMSCFGAMFAPNHQAVANELVRVCKPGGIVGMINFTPDGVGGEFFALLAPYAPPPPHGAQAPVLWGEEAHARGLFGNRVSELTATRQTYIERAPGAHDYCRLFADTFGPLVAIRAGLDAGRRAELDRAFLEAVLRWNTGRPGGPVEIPYEYLLLVARTNVAMKESAGTARDEHRHVDA